MPSARHLLSQRLLASNVIWSLAGAGLPLIVGLWTIPHLIEGLGKERFGLLAIIWMGIGYFSLFDLGIGRALTKLISERLGSGQTQDLPGLIKTGLRLMWWLGVLSAILASAISLWVITDVLKVEEHLLFESKWSFWLMAATLPFVVNSAGLIAILQAYQKFRAVTIVRIPLGVANFLGPAFALFFTDSLIASTGTIAVSRILAWLAYMHVCAQHRASASFSDVSGKQTIKNLLGYGGWITVSNVLGPLMWSFDRFIIGSVLGLAAVSYYVTPFEIVTRLLIIPTAVADVLFPALAAALVGYVTKAREIYIAAVRAQFLIMFPVLVFITLFGYELLAFWVGSEFAENSTKVLIWLALGVYINSFAKMPYTLLQSHGRPDITAKLHLVELPLYLGTLWWMMKLWGIEGAAMAWAARMIFESFMLFVFAAREIRSLLVVQYQVMIVVGASGILLVLSWLIETVVIKFAVMALIMLVSVLIAYPAMRRVILSPRVKYPEV